MPEKSDTDKSKHHIRADITAELDDQIDKAVALMKFRGDKERSDRSKLIRKVLEEYVATLETDIARMEAVAKEQAPPAPPAKSASRKSHK